MRPEPRRLQRLQRLETVRAMAKMTAAREAAESEASLSQMRALALRSQGLVDDYAARADTQDAGQLQQISQFRARLQSIVVGAQADASRAQVQADHKMARLAEAERRRQAVEDRVRSEAQAIARQSQDPPLTARRGLGTPFE